MRSLNFAESRAPLEALESRRLLAATSTPLLAAYAGDQPAGALTGYIVYTSAGHGFEASGSNWQTGRGENNEMVEDLGNQDQLAFYADYLWHAGATVVPMRPIGHQPNEVVLDNDSPGVTFSGSWLNSTFSRYYGEASDSVSYRYANVTANETAVATYRPNIPESGIYPVYTWVLDSSNRSNQLYRVNHTGGSSEVRVDHRKVGKGWVYLGSYHFDAGTSGSVEISNDGDGSGGSVVIADAIRFGNGMGDIDPGTGVSGQTREDEASKYWIQASLGQGADFSIGSNVSAPSRFAAYMNSAPFGQSVYIGFHSNAGGGRGADGLYNRADLFPGTNTPNQFALADLLGREVNTDLRALTTAPGNPYEHEWVLTSGHTYARTDYAFGEIRGDWTGYEFDATILEVAYHDNQQDAELMRDPKVRDAVARSTYEGTLKYFNRFGTGPSVSVTTVPGAPTFARAVGLPNGNLRVSWNAPVASGTTGGAATGYQIFLSHDGEGFGSPISVSGTSVDLTPAQLAAAGFAAGEPVFFRVQATNAGGRSLPSRVVGSRVTASSAPRVLIVDAFDRFDRSQNVTQTTSLNYNPPNNPGGSTFDRVRPQLMNSFDYAAAAGLALSAYAGDLSFDTVHSSYFAANGAAGYDAVIWLNGEESTADETFSAAEQAQMSSFVSNGGKVFASGAEIGWDLVARGSASDTSFFTNTLKAGYVSDDAGTYSVSGTSGSIFAGLSFGFDDGSQFYNVEFPDVLRAAAGSVAALSYVGGTGGAAAVQFAAGATRVVTMGFPFETITSAARRAQVMERVLDFFGLRDTQPPVVTTSSFAYETEQAVTFEFSEDVAASLTAGDLRLLNQTTGQTIPSTQLVLRHQSTAGGGTRATWVYNGVLPDGNYRATLPAGTVADAAGNTLASDVSQSFFVLAGDATRDRNVDFADFLRVRANFGKTSGAVFSDGDFTYDGKVDFADFLVLRSRFGVSLPPPSGSGSLFADSPIDGGGDGSGGTVAGVVA